MSEQVGLQIGARSTISKLTDDPATCSECQLVQHLCPCLLSLHSLRFELAGWPGWNPHCCRETHVCVCSNMR